METNTLTPNYSAQYISTKSRYDEIMKIAAENPNAYFNNSDLRKEASELAAQLKIIK